MEAGFYKYDDGGVFYAPNFVDGPNVLLVKEDHGTYTYPVQGWYWFDTKEAAYAFFGVELNDV